MIVRREHPGDEASIYEVHARAFPTTVEARLVDDLRASNEWLPRLSLVAVDGEAIVGHVVCTRAWIDPAAEPVLGLGPIGVMPGKHGRGVGRSLMVAVLAAAEALDETMVGLLGDPLFYSRFGFCLSHLFSIQPPDPAWKEHFQVRVLAATPPAGGTFRYAEPFSRV